jgi:hypothetical protein
MMQKEMHLLKKRRKDYCKEGNCRKKYELAGSQKNLNKNL